MLQHRSQTRERAATADDRHPQHTHHLTLHTNLFILFSVTMAPTAPSWTQATAPHSLAVIPFSPENMGTGQEHRLTTAASKKAKHYLSPSWDIIPRSDFIGCKDRGLDSHWIPKGTACLAASKGPSHLISPHLCTHTHTHIH